MAHGGWTLQVKGKAVIVVAFYVEAAAGIALAALPAACTAPTFTNRGVFSQGLDWRADVSLEISY